MNGFEDLLHKGPNADSGSANTFSSTENVTWTHWMPSRYRRQSYYKDKPYYGGVPRRNSQGIVVRILSSKVLVTFMCLFIYYIWHQFFYITQLDGIASINSIPRFENPMLNRKLLPDIQNAQLWQERQQQVVDAFSESWEAYRKKAWGMDEFHPISGNGRNFGDAGFSSTANPTGWIIVDALDTLMLMNQTSYVEEARDWIINKLDFDQNKEVNLFETTIRTFGGLLSAYYLSGGDHVYLLKASDLAERLIYAFNSSSGIPYASVNLRSHDTVNGDMGRSSTAEVSTVQLEFKYLSHLLNRSDYWEKAEKVIEKLVENKPADGLAPIFISPESGHFIGQEIRLGSRGDSYYEYLLKQYLQTGKTETMYREIYDYAMDGVKNHLVSYSKPNSLLFIGELPNGVNGALSPKMDHLVCFLGGNLVLGATEGKTYKSAKKLGWSYRQESDFQIGKELTRSCMETYLFTASGLAPEIVYFNTDQHKSEDIIIKSLDGHNLQRPETVESLYILWKITGDEKYR